MRRRCVALTAPACRLRGFLLRRLWEGLPSPRRASLSSCQPPPDGLRLSSGGRDAVCVLTSQDKQRPSDVTRFPLLLSRTDLLLILPLCKVFHV